MEEKFFKNEICLNPQTFHGGKEMETIHDILDYLSVVLFLALLLQGICCYVNGGLFF
jgi:hypothetical protein